MRVIPLAGIAGQSGYVNGPATLAAKFSGPHGLRRDALGSAFPHRPTRPTAHSPHPDGGDATARGHTANRLGGFPAAALSVRLRTDQPFVFNNDAIVAILRSRPRRRSSLTARLRLVRWRTRFRAQPRGGATPPAYRNGLSRNQVADSILSSQPDVTVKAIGTQDGRRSSAIRGGAFPVQGGQSHYLGENSAGFNLATTTTNAVMWFTTDGSEPTNAAPSLGPLSGATTLSLVMTNDISRSRSALSRPATKPACGDQDFFADELCAESDFVRFRGRRGVE